ncbi:unnamed protein product [Clonostachys byssicola]|uniref:Dicer-like protein 2 n=1 Tax=Clonostachys byssicola TaxID=160290 RepID=A0A9N9U7G3_9HYPO|nr:unnamed protein product [Clonostachys byssicola]
MALPKYSPSTSAGSDEGSLNDDSSDRSVDNGALLEVSPEPEGEAVEDTTENMDSRAYQLEMFQRSLKENVIVAMDTGSGKTQVALLRINAELERGPQKKLIWFLAPTVLLCGQQCDIIRLRFPSYPTKMLTSQDNVDAWSPKIWKRVLKSFRVVVSTPQILYDALSHSYLDISRLSLIIFDEAHNCSGNSAGGKIMKDFYHPQKQKNKSIPSILGLTASPAVSKKTKGFELLEETLDSRCVTPTIHREELLKWVNRPKISHIEYTLPVDEVYTSAISSLMDVYAQMDIKEDPRVRMLAADPTDRNRRLLEDAVMKNNTNSQTQFRRLLARSLEIALQLGPWAADHYLSRVIEEYTVKAKESHDYFDDWLQEEKKYITELLSKVQVAPPIEQPRPEDISVKVKKLVKELLSIEESPVGIIFVKERATVSILCDLLGTYTDIAHKYRIGTVVGTSSYQNKKRTIYDFFSEIDLSVLQKFRSGKINLLIATSVLEEGIDVPACNLVICFDQLDTIKSFIQRRGRARMRESRLTLFLEKSSKVVSKWEDAEEEMKRQCQDEERQVKRVKTIESQEESNKGCFIVKSTNARLDFDNAKQHLEHFCRNLSRGEFVDARPDYIVHRSSEELGCDLTATVLLPPFLPAELRTAHSKNAWKSEKNATKDAAFEAYLAIYKAGLLSEHLLPFSREQIPGVEARAPTADVESSFTPWKEVVRAWEANAGQWVYTFTCVTDKGDSLGEYDIILPVQLSQIRPIQIYRDYSTIWTIHSSPGRFISNEEAAQLPDHTITLLSLNFAHRWEVRDEPNVIKTVVREMDIKLDQIGSEKLEDHWKAIEDHEFLIRDPGGMPFFYLSTLPSKPPGEKVQHRFKGFEEAETNVPYLVLDRWTKRADFLHPLLSDAPEPVKPYPWVLPYPSARVDSIPVKFATFGMLLPTIIHEIEVQLTTKHLAATLLEPLAFSNLDLIREAISSKAALEPLHYERLEFLGDSILKYCAAVQVSALHPEWPEGYLSAFKDRLVSNSRLSKAALQKGLPKFILTESFTGLKWRPLYRSDFLQGEVANPSQGRTLSTKVLADVVEALMGASYHDGGIDKACQCICLFIDEKWPSVDVARRSLYESQPNIVREIPAFATLEEILSYSFQKKSLLVEAMTHASYVIANGSRSLERLEFLGDAILDKIVVTKLFALDPPLPHDRMHTLKTTLVNGDFLAFIAMENGIRQEETVVTEDLEVVPEKGIIPLWNFMRHSSTTIGLEQAAVAQRHQNSREEIIQLFKTADRYPWAELARIQPRKFFSDIIEALIGAVWVDSGSIEVCAAVVERLGIFTYLERFVRDNVEVMHPKELIGKLAGTEKVKYEASFEENKDGDNVYSCKLYVGGRLVAEVDGSVSREHSKTAAATEAVKAWPRDEDTIMTEAGAIA